MVGCESDRSLNPSLSLFRKGPNGSKSLMLWLEFILNTFLIVADACGRVNHKYEVFQVRTIISRRFVQVRREPKDRPTHISNYQSSEHKSNQHDESD